MTTSFRNTIRNTVGVAATAAALALGPQNADAQSCNDITAAFNRVTDKNVVMAAHGLTNIDSDPALEGDIYLRGDTKSVLLNISHAKDLSLSGPASAYATKQNNRVVSVDAAAIRAKGPGRYVLAIGSTDCADKATRGVEATFVVPSATTRLPANAYDSRAADQALDKRVTAVEANATSALNIVDSLGRLGDARTADQRVTDSVQNAMVERLAARDSVYGAQQRGTQAGTAVAPVAAKSQPLQTRVASTNTRTASTSGQAIFDLGIGGGVQNTTYSPRDDGSVAGTVKGTALGGIARLSVPIGNAAELYIMGGGASTSGTSSAPGVRGLPATEEKLSGYDLDGSARVQARFGILGGVAGTGFRYVCTNGVDQLRTSVEGAGMLGTRKLNAQLGARANLNGSSTTPSQKTELTPFVRGVYDSRINGDGRVAVEVTATRKNAVGDTLSNYSGTGLEAKAFLDVYRSNRLGLTLWTSAIMDKEQLRRPEGITGPEQDISRNGVRGGAALSLYFGNR